MCDQVENPFAIKSISSMYLKSEFADVHFTFPNDDANEKVPAHKSLLATVSPGKTNWLYQLVKFNFIILIY